jgi:hypothetical protein
MKLRRYWLDVDFPTSPPPEFERSGIEITDEFITWTTMPVDSLTVFKIRQALWPSALAKSFWNFTKVLVTDDIKRIAKMLGFKSSSQTSMEQVLARHAKQFPNGMVKEGGPSKDDVPSKNGPLPRPRRSLDDANQAMVKAPVTDKPSPPAQAPDNGASQAKAVVQSIGLHFIGPMLAFKSKLAQTWRPAPNYPPRGCIIVSGLVELDSPKAWLVVDVKAAWDPKTRTYDPRSMHLGLRRMQMKKQGPLGGS